MSSSNSFTPFDHSDDQQPTKPIVNNISNIDDNIIPNSSELDRDMLSTDDNISQQNSDSTINAGTSTTDTTTTSKKVFKKKPTVDPNYILFGYIPNYKIPFVNITISYPLDVISDKVRYVHFFFLYKTFYRTFIKYLFFFIGILLRKLVSVRKESLKNRSRQDYNPLFMVVKFRKKVFSLIFNHLVVIKNR